MVEVEDGELFDEMAGSVVGRLTDVSPDQDPMQEDPGDCAQHSTSSSAYAEGSETSTEDGSESSTSVEDRECFDPRLRSNTQGDGEAGHLGGGCQGGEHDAPKERDTQWYEERKGCALFLGCKMTVLQMAFALLSLKLRYKVTEVAMGALCQLLAFAILPEGNCMPHNMYAVRKLCQVMSSTEVTYHCCQDDHHIWDYVPQNEWHKHYHDVCPVRGCGKRRFKESRGSANRCTYTPVKVVYYFGL